MPPALLRLSYAGKALDDAQRTLQHYGVAYWHAKFPAWPLRIRKRECFLAVCCFSRAFAVAAAAADTRRFLTRCPDRRRLNGSATSSLAQATEASEMLECTPHTGVKRWLSPAQHGRQHGSLLELGESLSFSSRGL